ncbi:related to Retrovirus-related POL polyprotein [Ustilago bromivora]|uniref:Related to Retrovirus-related POL polyprotein n=1 Tax=Ustilago bromivora TaxID=307758 RepID=A0A1K0G7H3_9BASI|nr:related to Retrovirus-related POL polyprotein [Ustilago bromivora]
MFCPMAWIIPKLESQSFATLPPLCDNRGTHNSPEEKLLAIQRFYTALFILMPSTQLTEEAASTLLSSVQGRISSTTHHLCEAPFTMDKLCSVLVQSQEMSTPGLDGISYPLFHILGTTALEKLCRLGNALLCGHHLPDGKPMLRGVLLPKKGDLGLLQNYHLLSIAASSFWLLGGAILKCLQAATQEVISPSQTGFILGHHSASNVITLYLLQHAVQTGKVLGPIWVLNLDQHKAYDRGDPMSCLLYNFSLQPMLDYAKHHHQAGIELNWDADNPMFASSLAFADDILLIVSTRHDLMNFLDALNLYRRASNAKVNKTKSQAFSLSKDQSLADDSLKADIPYPILNDEQAEIIHLGYPFRLDGGIPHITIEWRLASLQAKVNILSTAKTTLLARAQMINAFLLSKLWHTIRLCPIPYTLQHHLNSILNPFLFLGQRNWIHHAYVVSPRHLGGLGVIDTDTMSIALIGQMAANLLQSKEPIEWNSIVVQGLLALPFYNDMFCYTWPEIHATNAQHWEHHGLHVWGDLLWYNPNERGKIDHPYVCTNAYPLVPPSPAGCKNNYIASQGHPATYELFSTAAGRLLARHWVDMWDKLHPTVCSKLLDTSKIFAIHPNHAKSKKNLCPHDCLFNIDTIGLPFPWHLVTLAEKPIAAYTVKHARTFLSSSNVIKPQWPFEATDTQWWQVWEWYNHASLLTSEALSDVFLFLHSWPWLAQKPRGDRRLTNHNILNNDPIALRTLAHQADTSEAIIDTYREEHVFRVSSCMLCNDPKDSTIHGFIKCDYAQ